MESVGQHTALRFNKETYDEAVNLDRYDFFSILTDKIFTHDIHWLLGEILRRNKRFFLVRTKIDQAIENARKHPPKQNAEVVMETTRKKITEALDISLEDFKEQNPRLTFAYNPKGFKVYFVDNHDPTAYDFPQLQEDLFRDVLQFTFFKKISTNKKFRSIFLKKTTQNA